ncbi:peptidylprolyl isomerase [Brachymonas chironomi]|uniref:peptidylprolyl isomerase n=1 Tax=Brachymonas chironomi TaxID=491919 RepID=UPI000373BF75|nr:peptidylprolyl isomerase [Brachymonas chironomi]
MTVRKSSFLHRFHAPAFACALLLGGQAVLPAAQAQTARSGVQSDYIVAVVNKEPVTNREVQVRANELARSLSAAKQPVPTRQALLQRALDDVIFQKAAIQSARATSIAISDEELDVRERALARQANLDVEKYRARFIQERRIAPSQYRAALRDAFLLERVRDARVNQEMAKVSDLEALRALREQRIKQGLPDSLVPAVRMAQILIAVPPGSSPQEVQALQEKANNAVKALRNGQEFLQVAREYSDIPPQASPLVPQEQLAPDLAAAIRNVPLGQSTDAVRTEDGFHIIQVVERQHIDMAFGITETRARHILLIPSAKLSEKQATAQLAQVRRDIASGKTDFADAARRLSMDGSAQQGGDLGWAQPGMFVPEFEERLDKLQAAGNMTQPFTSRFGVHLVQLLERRSAPMTQAQQVAMARAALREQRAGEALRNWEEEIRGRAYIEMRRTPS